MKPRISMITLGVDDLDRSIEFYQKGLGFPRHGDAEGVAFFSLDGTWLGLFNRESLAKDAQVICREAGFNSFSLAHNVHSKEEVHSIIDQARAAGAEIVKEPQTVFWGGYSGYFRDPDGHLWEVAMNPYTWIGPDDK